MKWTFKWNQNDKGWTSERSGKTSYCRLDICDGDNVIGFMHCDDLLPGPTNDAEQKAIGDILDKDGEVTLEFRLSEEKP